MDERRRTHGRAPVRRRAAGGVSYRRPDWGPRLRAVHRHAVTVLAAAGVALSLGLIADTTVVDVPDPGRGALCPFRSPAVARSPVQPSTDPAALLWSDEFDGPAGATVDAERWFVHTGGLGWGDGELQAYTDLPTNVARDGAGNLLITARREPGAAGAEYTSGRISTCGALEFNHGRVEARIRVPSGQGLWPAFWLVGAEEPWPQHGEIDIMESVNDMRAVDFNAHQPLDDGGDWELALPAARLPGGTTWAGEFHVFAVDWTADELVWSVDGIELARTSRDDVPDGGRWVVDRSPQVVVLNLAVGGYPGAPDAGTPLPAAVQVDYVRIYANADTIVGYSSGAGSRGASGGSP